MDSDRTLDQLLQRTSASMLASLEDAIDIGQHLNDLHRRASDSQAMPEETEDPEESFLQKEELRGRPAENAVIWSEALRSLEPSEHL